MKAEVAQPGTAVGLINQLATQGFVGSNPTLRTSPLHGVETTMDETERASAGAKPRNNDEQDGLPEINAISVLRRVCELADDVDRMASRRPQDAPGASAAQRGRCLTCPLNPSRVFPRLNTVLLEDVTKFNTAFKADVLALQRFTPPNKTCLDCAAQTVSDFEALYLLFERFARWMAAAKRRRGIGPGA